MDPHTHETGPSLQNEPHNATHDRTGLTATHDRTGGPMDENDDMPDESELEALEDDIDEADISPWRQR